MSRLRGIYIFSANLKPTQNNLITFKSLFYLRLAIAYLFSINSTLFQTVRNFIFLNRISYTAIIFRSLKKSWLLADSETLHSSRSSPSVSFKNHTQSVSIPAAFAQAAANHQPQTSYLLHGRPERNKISHYPFDSPAEIAFSREFSRHAEDSRFSSFVPLRKFSCLRATFCLY